VSVVIDVIQVFGNCRITEVVATENVCMEKEERRKGREKKNRVRDKFDVRASTIFSCCFVEDLRLIR
jgi:hypothetical protein